MRQVRDVLAHLPLALFRPPQAVALPLVPAYKLGGTEGREPSLHVDAFASTLRPLSPPFPPTAPSSGAYPLFPVFLPCGSAAPRSEGNIVPRDRGTEGLATLPAVGTTTTASESGAG